MTHLDFDELASLWQEEPKGEERRDFSAIADRAARRAQLVQYAEHGLALLLVAAVMIAVSLAPAPATMAIGALSIVALGWSSWKRHLLTEVEIMVTTSDRAELLDHAATALGARIWRARLGLWLFFPGAFLAGLFTHSLTQGGDLSGFADVLIQGAFGTRAGLVIVFLVVVLVAQMIQSLARLHRELARLEGLREDYAREARLDVFGI